MGKSNISLCFVVFCGIPASGKTTICRQLKIDLAVKNIEAIHICYDNLIDNASDLEELSWKARRRQITADICSACSLLRKPPDEAHGSQSELCRQIVASLSQPRGGQVQGHTATEREGYDGERNCEGLEGYDGERNCEGLEDSGGGGLVLLIDDNMFYRSMRQEYYKMAAAFECSFCQVLVNIPLHVALSRNGRRGDDSLPEETLVAMARTLEVPGSLAWERGALAVDGSECAGPQIHEIVMLVLDSLKNPLKFASPAVREEKLAQKASDKLMTSSNLLHQSDVILRRIVATTMQNQSHDLGQNKAKVADLANKARKIVLEGIQQGSVGLPDEELNSTNNERLRSMLETLFMEQLRTGK